MYGAKTVRNTKGRPNLGLASWCILCLMLGYLLGSFSTSPRHKEQYTATISIETHSDHVQPAGSSAGAGQDVFRRSNQQHVQLPGTATKHKQAVSAEALPLYVATAANSGYFGGLTNLVGSLRFWCPECHVLVYNLGLSPEQLTTVKGWCNTTLLWEEGVGGAGHLREAKKYAWKPLAILDAVNTFKRVLWLDAGSTVTAPLKTTVWPLLLKDGHFLVQGQDLDMVPWCHDLTWQYFKLDKNKFRGKPSYSGNTMGYVYDSPAYHKILKPWVDCAKVEACMAPQGTSTANHRFDQAVLSIITYTSDLNVTEHTELLLAAPVECYKPHARAVWTSRQGCSCYQKFAVGCAAAQTLQLPVEGTPVSM